MQNFFYDGQIRRFLLQFIRVLSNFQVEYGKDDAGHVTLVRVPVKYGDSSRQASQILNNASENTIAGVVPMISVYISDLKYDRPRLQEPYFVSKMNIRQREFNKVTGEFGNGPGNAFTVERLMPVPYKLTMKVDVWASNITQKLQLTEQMVILFNPSMEIQNTDNYIDWTSLTVIELVDTIFSSRTIPVGNDDPIDISTFTFELPIWISAPVKVKKLGVVDKIINSIYDSGGDIDTAIFNQDLLLGTRQYFTPLNYGIILLNGTVQLVKYNEPVSSSTDLMTLPFKYGTPDDWTQLIALYGKMKDGISQIRIGSDDIGSYIMGTIAGDPADATKLLFTVDPDTIPGNTMRPITAIIDPVRSGPGAGLPMPVLGTRYLLLGNIGDSSNIDGADAWKSTDGHDLIAAQYDIIEYDGEKWIVSFDSSTELTKQYATNLTTGIQYAWTGSTWEKSYEGEYGAGRWSLII